MARVSNPDAKPDAPASRLIRYLIKHHHWSPFEMVDMCVEITTTRDIGRQLLRHRSFYFQEQSQRYQDVTHFPSAGYREARMQDPVNRQNSIPTEERYMHKWWAEMQRGVETIAHEVYERALARGLAKEVARAVLPEGLTATKMYMKGSVRSWIHFCQLRMGHGTQRETQMLAEQCYELLRKEYPSVVEALTEAQTPLPS
jgi:thymidylate synthase (FAD)